MVSIAIWLGSVGLLALGGALWKDAPPIDSAPVRARVTNPTCEAKDWATTGRHARLDETTINQFWSQVPEDIEPTDERRGSDLLVTWTFTDKSYIRGRFTPVPGDMALNTVAVECE